MASPRQPSSNAAPDPQAAGGDLHNDLTDVPGMRVGHATCTDPGWRTGTTVVLAPPGGACAGVDVRGAAPGTRETDLLDPGNLVDRVNAVVLTGGSAPGLASVDGVVAELTGAQVGWPVMPGMVVPIVPAAVLFDLGRGGLPARHPGPQHGAAAVRAATGGPVELGPVGAATGAVAGGLAGGIGSASAVLSSGARVAALVAVNALGTPVDPGTGELYAASACAPGDLPTMPAPDAAGLAAYLGRRAETAAALGLVVPGTNTTIGVLATDVTLDAAGCRRLASVGHDGLARALRPAHTMLDGDTLFALSTRGRELTGLAELYELQALAADCVERAIARGIVAATTVQHADGQVLCYREALRR